MSQSQSQTILIVEDDPVIQMITSAGLGRNGWAIRQANSADEALASMQADPPDLVLVSISLPDGDGFSLIEAVRRGQAGSSDRDIPILVLTAQDDTASIHQAFGVGATDFITKPAKLALLLVRVEYALAAAAQDQALADARMEQAIACRMARLGSWRLDHVTGRLQWSVGAAELLGCATLPETREALIERAADSNRYRLEAAFDSAIAGERGVDIECTFWLLDDDPTILRLQSEASHNQTWLIGAFQDVTGLRAFEDRARYRAEYDELTDLPRHRHFNRVLRNHISEQGGQPWSVTVIEIIGLSRINAMLGISAGDQIIATFAQRLRGVLSENAVAGRLEANTFAIASPVDTIDVPIADYEKWLAPLAHSLSVAGEEVFVDFCAGASLYPSDASDAETLINRAQWAQQSNRDHRGHRRVVLYPETEELEESGVLSLESDIRKALGRGELFLVYQFQQPADGGPFSGVEALLRWRHPVHGVISPGRFIPMLEEIGLIGDVGEWVLDEACRQLAIWHEANATLVMGVNISAQQFERGDLADRVTRIAHRHRVDPRTIELEITESMAIHNPDASQRILEQLRAAGFRLAIDDFGTGYASYESLLRFPIDTLKIDRSLIEAVTDDRRNRSIIRSINSLADGLRFKTIAEGVETQRQRDYMHALEIDATQGFLIHRPMEADACTGLLTPSSKEEG